MFGRRMLCAGLLLSLPSLTGCLFVRHRVKEVREDEIRQPVQYESELAQEMFTDRAEDEAARTRTGSTSAVAIPFVLWWSKTTVKSSSAYFNDQIAACDRNKDGLITEFEAHKFNPDFGTPRVENIAEVPVEDDKGVRQASASSKRTTTSSKRTGSKPKDSSRFVDRK